MSTWFALQLWLTYLPVGKLLMLMSLVIMSIGLLIKQALDTNT